MHQIIVLYNKDEAHRSRHIWALLLLGSGFKGGFWGSELLTGFLGTRQGNIAA